MYDHDDDRLFSMTLIAYNTVAIGCLAFILWASFIFKPEPGSSAECLSKTACALAGVVVGSRLALGFGLDRD